MCEGPLGKAVAELAQETGYVAASWSPLPPPEAIVAANPGVSPKPCFHVARRFATVLLNARRRGHRLSNKTLSPIYALGL